MKPVKFISLLLGMAAATVSAGTTGLPIAAINEIETNADGWMRAVSGDPYLTFQAGGVPVESIRYLQIQMAGKHVLNRHLYLELFWATETHGYTEEKKGFYIQPFSVRGEQPLQVILNLGEFLEVMGDAGTHLHMVRLDFDPEIRNQDFQFQVDVALLQEPPAGSATTRFLAIHPPYLSQYVMDARIFRYTVHLLVLEVLHKVFRDPFFLILFLPLLGITLGLLWQVSKSR